jgi:GAF domain-containing protein
MATPPASSRGIGAVLAEFAQEMANERSPADILNRLADYCTELLPVQGVGMLLKSAGGQIEFGTANTEVGKTVEQLEADLREGPCTDCLVSGTYLAVPDLEHAKEQYPRFAPRALEAGVRAIHALPMTARTEVIGSVDIIAADVLDLTAEQIATAQLLVDVAVSYVSNTRAFEDKSRLASQLQFALDSRIMIEQAKGILSERRKITVTEAFELLRGYARSNHLKLHDAAGAIVRGQLDL